MPAEEQQTLMQRQTQLENQYQDAKKAKTALKRFLEGEEVDVFSIQRPAETRSTER